MAAPRLSTPLPPIWTLAHPLWLCAFRPFFALTALSALGLMLPWVLFLTLGWPLPALGGGAGGALAWHAHELLLGMGLAAAAGFALTTVPEFTRTSAFAARHVRRLAACWLAARLAFAASGAWAPGLLLTAALHMVLLADLLRLLWPRLWHAPERRHLAFAWALAALGLAALGFYVQAWRGQHAMPWLHGVLGAYMALIVVALSRISMSIVNASLEALNVRDDEGQPLHYLARPPRRNLAVLCIALHTVAQVLQWPASTSGWLALAAAAALLNLLNDWHVGRALLTRWPLMLYAVYVFMAAGYGLMGLAGLGLAVPASAGLHLLTAGAFGLAILLVLVIAGYTHSGLRKEGRPWVLLAATCVALAAVLRALSYALLPQWLLPLSGLLWAAGFALLAWHMLPVWLSPRADGAEGCAGVAEGSGG